MDADQSSRAAAKLKIGGYVLADLPLSMVLTDPNRPDNPICYVNRAFEQTTGYAASHAIGRNCRFLQGHLTDQPAAAELRRAVEAREAATVLIRNVRADGSEFLNRLMIAPVHDEDGNLFAFTGIQTVVLDDDTETDPAIDYEARLTEMQHRVKNHLQMVASMIRLKGTGEGRDARTFNALSRRVETLAALYDEFSAPPKEVGGRRYDVVSSGAYIGRVVAAIAALDGRGGIRVTIDTDNVFMPAGRAATLGLLVSELMSNAVQHAFVDRDEGLIEVRLTAAGGDRVRLTVADDGVGLGDSAWPASGGTGARIVRGLADDLQGDLHVSTGRRGTTVSLDFLSDMPVSHDRSGRRIRTDD